MSTRRSVVPHSTPEQLGVVSSADTLTPAERYEELFVAVQMSNIFEDSKTFVDCAPRMAPERILRAYRAAHGARDFDLKAFVLEHFDIQLMPTNGFVSNPDRSLAEHVESLWPILTRQPLGQPARSSLLPLPHPYLVPGGRFTEAYYWDSYFSMLGLDPVDHSEVLLGMVDNFAYLIDTYGHVPNGNRTYYLSRSQPPFFSLMVRRLEEYGICDGIEYLEQLRKEYAFWMDGAEELRAGDAHRRCMRMKDGSLLNRYWDDRDTPRDESHREDVLTARRANRPVHDVYRDLRAGAESGWDFSSRWQSDPHDISTIRTTSIVPVDLNCFLLELEREIARLSERSSEKDTASHFDMKVRARCAAIDEYFWNESIGAYFDFDWQLQQQRPNLTAATVVPLFARCASPEQANRVASIVEARLLAAGGLSTTEVTESVEQWDCPNGWAPLQWMGVTGLSNYGHEALAAEIRRRWLKIVAHLYQLEGKLVEKYVLRPTAEHAGGGEYPLQDGFGWTNGVVGRFLKEEPEHPANACRSTAGVARTGQG